MLGSLRLSLCNWVFTQSEKPGFLPHYKVDGHGTYVYWCAVRVCEYVWMYLWVYGPTCLNCEWEIDGHSIKVPLHEFPSHPPSISSHHVLVLMWFPRKNIPDRVFPKICRTKSECPNNSLLDSKERKYMVYDFNKLILIGFGIVILLKEIWLTFQKICVDIGCQMCQKWKRRDPREFPELCLHFAICNFHNFPRPRKYCRAVSFRPSEAIWLIISGSGRWSHHQIDFQVKWHDKNRTGRENFIDKLLAGSKVLGSTQNRDEKVGWGPLKAKAKYTHSIKYTLKKHLDTMWGVCFGYPVRLTDGGGGSIGQPVSKCCCFWVAREQLNQMAKQTPCHIAQQSDLGRKRVAV